MKSTLKKSLTIILCLLMVLLSLSVAPVTADDTSSETETTKTVKIKHEFNKATNFKSLGQSDMWQIAYEDSASQMLVDTVNATVAVLDKASGHLWKSNLTEQEMAGSTLSETVKYDALSQFVLNYCDSANHEKVFSSYQYGVKEGKYEITNIDNGVRIEYNVGKNSDDFCFPQVMRKTTYDALSAKMTPEQQTQLKGYYKYYDYNEMEEALKLSLSTQYPIVKSEPIYVSNVQAKVVKQKFVREVLYDLDINEDWIVEEYNAVGFTGFQLPDSANFNVTLEYTLSGGKLNVKIPEDGIAYSSTQYVLTDITLLPYFGSEINVESGSMFIPDGSGALIDITRDESSIISLPFYGNDYAMRTKEYAENTRQAVLPVYGIINGNSAFIANVTEGAEVGSVEAHLKYDIYPVARICTNYILNEFEEYSSQGQTSSATLIKYSKGMYNRPISIDYYFLAADKANYVGMASAIRDAYFSGQSKVTDTQAKFIMETYGAAIRKEYFLGYPLSKFVSFTDVSEAQKMYDELSRAGVSNIDVKYNNWSIDKYRNDISKIGNLSGKVASTSEWKEFEKYLADAGSSLYAGVDLVFDKNSGSVFDAPWHAKEMDGTLIKYADTGDVYSHGVTDSLFMTIIKNKEMLNRLDGVFAKLKKLDIDSVCYETMGRFIFSDYNENDESLRDEIVDGYRQALSKADEDGQNIMVTTGNAYTFDYADIITDIPMGDSRFYFEEQIPFLQIVLNGYINYTGQAVNIADNIETNYLKSVEYGAGLRYVLNDIEAKLVKDTNYSNLYTTQYNRWYDDAVSRYEKLAAATDGTQSSVIVNHEKLQNNVYRTTYENGAYVIVNYNTYDVTVDGNTVTATDFIYGNK